MLVATSVIEVGIDVANATVMLVEGAERYGLSQLHQLRGRVGRGEHASHCILFADAGSELARRRLAAIEAERDGFKLAEVDLALRGEGEILGTRQHGLPRFRVAELPEDVAVLIEARRELIELLDRHGSLEAPELGPLLQAARERFGDERAERSGVTMAREDSPVEDRRRRAQGTPPGGAAAALGGRSADRGPRARGAVRDPRGGRAGRASSTSTAAPGRWASRPSPAGPPGRPWSTPTSRSPGATCASSAWSDRAEVVRSDALALPAALPPALRPDLLRPAL